MEREKYLPTIGRFISSGIILAAGVALSNFAFTRSVRRQIWSRDGGVSALSGRSDQKRECAHWDHDRSNPYYNHKDNGRLLLVSEHYMDHVDREGENGLSLDGNQFALEKIWDRMTNEAQEEVIALGYRPPKEVVEGAIQLAFGY